MLSILWRWVCMVSTALRTENASTSEPKELPLFADIPSFSPDTQWLDGKSTNQPFFDQASRMRDIVSGIKNDLLDDAIEGCELVLSSQEPSPETAALRGSLETHPELWKAMISVQKYGAIYLMSRSDARRYLPVIQENAVEAAQIADFLQQDAIGIRILNYTVHEFVTGGKHCQADKPPMLVPPNALAAVGERHVAVRAADFPNPDGKVIDNPNPLYDLHDFAHLSAAALSPELYGSKYFTDLIKLPSGMTKLIRSPGMKTGKGPKISDGMLFTELLTGIFTYEAEQSHTYQTAVDAMSRKLADYLLGKCDLQHGSTHEMIKPSHPVTPLELAVLAQNKAYEHTASEIEQRIFTRGGNDKRDILAGMTAMQRAEHLASSKAWMYFEVRNTLKHRAHKEAYRLVAQQYIADGVEPELCRTILDNLTFNDFRKGNRVNLWSLILSRAQ